MPAIAPVTPYLATAAIAWVYYRRIRRSFGRQPWQSTRTVVRLVLASVVACLLLVLAVVAPHVGLGMAAGAVIGTVVGLLSLRHTHAEWVEGRGWYTPNPWIGGALSVLLVARLAWRWGQGAFSDGSQQAIQQASPLTLAIAATFIVYGLVYSAGLLLRMRRLQASAQATVSE